MSSLRFIFRISSKSHHLTKRDFHNNFGHLNMASVGLRTLNGFDAKSDIYQGMTVETQELALSDKEFEDTLQISLTNWNKAKVRGVWFKVNIAKSSYIPALVKHGFVFHHAKPTYVMLTRWLPGDEPNLLPQFPFTHIDDVSVVLYCAHHFKVTFFHKDSGVGGMVINDKNEVLTVKEKYHQTRWKLPGGYSNPGEDFADTAMREVFEETGIQTKFVSVVSLRHHHKHIFNCSDVYVVCLLKPISSTIEKSKEEISECEWMDVETYRNHPQVTEFNRFIMNAFLESQKLKTSIGASPVLSFRKDCFNQVYHVKSITDS